MERFLFQDPKVQASFKKIATLRQQWKDLGPFNFWRSSGFCWKGRAAPARHVECAACIIHRGPAAPLVFLCCKRYRTRLERKMCSITSPRQKSCTGHAFFVRPATAQILRSFAGGIGFMWEWWTVTLSLTNVVLWSWFLNFLGGRDTSIIMFQKTSAGWTITQSHTLVAVRAEEGKTRVIEKGPEEHERCLEKGKRCWGWEGDK